MLFLDLFSQRWQCWLVHVYHYNSGYVSWTVPAMQWDIVTGDGKGAVGPSGLQAEVRAEWQQEEMHGQEHLGRGEPRAGQRSPEPSYNERSRVVASGSPAFLVLEPLLPLCLCCIPPVPASLR